MILYNIIYLKTINNIDTDNITLYDIRTVYIKNITEVTSSIYTKIIMKFNSLGLVVNKLSEISKNDILNIKNNILKKPTNKLPLLQMCSTFNLNSKLNVEKSLLNEKTNSIIVIDNTNIKKNNAYIYDIHKLLIGNITQIIKLNTISANLISYTNSIYNFLL